MPRPGDGDVKVIGISCPWCDAETSVALSELVDEFRCPECATTVELEPEPEIALPLAA
jgi:hypothetical protein